MFHIFQFTEDLCAAGSTGVATCGVNGCTCTSEELEEFVGFFFWESYEVNHRKSVHANVRSEIYDTWYYFNGLQAEIKKMHNSIVGRATFVFFHFFGTSVGPKWQFSQWPKAEVRILRFLGVFFFPEKVGGGNSLNHFFQFPTRKWGKIPTHFWRAYLFLKGLVQPPASQWFVSFSYPKF